MSKNKINLDSPLPSEDIALLIKYGRKLNALDDDKVISKKMPAPRLAIKKGITFFLI
jgi:hypothetical protein